MIKISVKGQDCYHAKGYFLSKDYWNYAYVVLAWMKERVPSTNVLLIQALDRGYIARG